MLVRRGSFWLGAGTVGERGCHLRAEVVDERGWHLRAEVVDELLPWEVLLTREGYYLRARGVVSARELFPRRGSCYLTTK